jgi:diguanylate cyclase (GGDEF)-like protein/PAS domain S-box-containing protein
MAITTSEAPSSREVENLLQPHRKALARLRRADGVSRSELDEAVAQVTELAAAVLEVERASVWRLTEQGKRIDCIDLFVRAKGTHVAEGTIASTSCPAYFAALATERTIAATEAHTDPRTAEFSETYLTPNGIGAMLDAPIFLRGEMVGVVCHEHVGGPRVWNLWEEVVAGTLADFVAHILEVEERAKELRESEESFRRLFDAAPTPLVLARVSDGTIALLNSRAREVIGVEKFEPYELPSVHFYDSPLDREAILEDVRTHGFVDNREMRMRTAAGEQRYCLLSARSLVYRGEPHIAVGFIDVSEMKKIEQQLRDAAMRDALTGIYNRRHFYEVGTRELDRARRYQRPLSLAMLDADHFKAVNDRYGHVVGDEVLVAIAKIASAELRRTDLVARYGGEELVVLFTETALDEAMRVTDRVRDTLHKTPIFTSAGPITVTLSGGVVEWSNADGTLEAFIERADRVLYRAKELGRNRIERSAAPIDDA